MAVIFTTLAFVQCGNDNNSSDPFNEQEKTPLYPSELTYINDNANSQTSEAWTFAYNADKTIKSYTFLQQLKRTTDNLTVSDEGSGMLNYGKDLDGNTRISNNITRRYSSRDNTNYDNYEEEILETVTFENGLIAKIASDCKRKDTNEMTYSEWTFEYINDYCTKATYKDSREQKNFTFKWNGYLLAQVTIHGQSKSGDLTTEMHEYSYNTKKVSNDYGFNPMGFIYGHLPKIYASMGLFGKMTPYILESDEYTMSVSNPAISSSPLQKVEVTRNYSVSDSYNSITYTVTDNNNESEYHFSK